jgi:hypothetical protein
VHHLIFLLIDEQLQPGFQKLSNRLHDPSACTSTSNQNNKAKKGNTGIIIVVEHGGVKMHKSGVLKMLVSNHCFPPSQKDF